MHHPSGATWPRAAEIAAAAQLACVLEVVAPKPGNVSPGRHFTDMRVEDFLASAAAIGPAMQDAAAAPLGVTIHDAIAATAQWTRVNTNLGIVLLLAPLARAANHLGPGEGLRAAVGRVVDETTVDDARHVYAAIRLASPGGLGAATSQDVADEPTAPLVEVMRLAAERDDVAREYATAYDTTFSLGAPTVRALRRSGHTWDEAIVQTFLTILAARPDTHIARRRGRHRAVDVSMQASKVLESGGVTTRSGWLAIDDLDAHLRHPDHTANPGTTADLVASSVFVQVLEERGLWSGAA